eukprot:COSAG02_NODE_49_length_45106_cov_298.436177_25_plen_192_part_00
MFFGNAGFGVLCTGIGVFYPLPSRTLRRQTLSESVWRRLRLLGTKQLDNQTTNLVQQFTIPVNTTRIIIGCREGGTPSLSAPAAYSRSSFVSLAIVGASEVRARVGARARAGACGPGGAWHALTGCVGLSADSYGTYDNMMSVRRSQDVWDCQLTIPVHLIPYRISVSAYHHRTVVRYGTVRRITEKDFFH